MVKTKKPPAARRASHTSDPGRGGHVVALLDEVTSHPETGLVLTGGDPDADWQRAYASGEEAVGGSEPTPDQDVVDELGRALGIEQETDAPLTISGEILRRRDRFRWHLERDAADADEGRPRRSVPR